ncbi:Bifunctional lycopene cyclase/phytoene synthase [Penicillium nucicola]|uniref:Bifunctional lycopene cyclase/phytoene synthase n=1 Tax=Penicillium nucicola TaxID=1850975 RepID=UPI00254506C0|nr:Bifunctional lycopene cyclase/phytoene synthase [Penicillium nucicola]KAJ5757145.1 Bifunctional lycopene cyclase/phytoene synthase [Penicillium nucicola]
MDPAKKKVVVIGAGVGGVAVAARLAQAGVNVSLYEKNNFLGGKCSSINRNGYRFDRGPSIMLMTEIFEETFQHLGTSMDDMNIELLKCEPNCITWLHDGESFTTSTDLAKMKNQIEKFEGNSGFHRFLDFLQEAQRHYEKSLIHVLKKDFPRLLSLLRPAFLPYVFQLHPFQNVWGRASHFFKSHSIRQVFTAATMYLGMSPLDTPGTYTLLQYSELAGGVWYPRGGFYRIVEALVNIGLRLGADYHLSVPVERVNISEGKVQGISLASSEVAADAVIINADLSYAYKELLPSLTPQAGKNKQLSCSSISFYWSLSKKVLQLETHNMFLDKSYGQNFYTPGLQMHGTIRPSFYIHVPSRIDPSAAPPGKDALIVLVLVENLGDTNPSDRQAKQDMEKLVNEVRNYVISTIEKRTGAVGVQGFIEDEIINTPFTWQDTFNSEKGAIFGIDHSFFNILAFRPKIKHDRLQGVYFVGASTHPGAGVPASLAGARLTAERVLEDLHISVPWNIATFKYLLFVSHLIWTIPPAVLMTAAYWPFLIKVELYKITTLIAIAVLFTIPWDSYLIRNRIWTYPTDAVVGLTLLDIPLEEVFFFVIQTYCTSLLYVILTKHLVLPVYLLPRASSAKKLGSLLLFPGIAVGALCSVLETKVTYLGLIIAWSLPVIALQWVLCSDFLLNMPKRPIAISIILPTLYLWIVDFFALQRGTWVIEQETKIGIQFFGFLELEEGIFFFVSNIMVVLGLVTVDHALAIAEYDAMISEPDEKNPRSFSRIAWSYLTTQRSFDIRFLEGLGTAIDKLAQKSQSMYLGSAMFQGRLRTDLILLYSFCRVIDDLVDEAPNQEAARASIQEASSLLHWHFSVKHPKKPLYDYLETEETKLADSPLLSSIVLLPASRLTLSPILELLSGFEMDLQFPVSSPISTEKDLELYAHRVAGTVAASLLELVFCNYELEVDHRIINAGQLTGQALQFVNIARDIKRDAAIDRVYIPTSWLAEEGMGPSDVLANPDDSRLARLEERMLRKAYSVYDKSVGASNELPIQARRPVRTTIESYMMIGEMVRRRRRAGVIANGKLKVPLWRRLRLAWWEMAVGR